MSDTTDQDGRPLFRLPGDLQKVCPGCGGTMRAYAPTPQQGSVGQLLMHWVCEGCGRVE